MAYKNNINLKQKKNNSLKYLNCLIEGMHEWLELKEKSGNKEILSKKNQIEKEILKIEKEIAPILFIKRIENKMKSLRMEKEVLVEFKGIFKL